MGSDSYKGVTERIHPEKTLYLHVIGISSGVVGRFKFYVKNKSSEPKIDS
jgi:hypothetical protein